MIETNFFHKTIVRSFFLQLIQYLRFEIKILDRTRLVKLIVQRVKKIKTTVLNDLQRNIKMSIACDVWSSFNKLTFLKMTVYFIDKNWHYRKILFTFKFLQKKHDDEKLIDVVLNVFKTHKFENRLMIMTINNAFNNRILRRHLFKKFQKQNIEWNDEQKTFNCMTHVLQLTVTIIMTNLNVQIRNDDIAFKFDIENFRKMNEISSLNNTIRKINFCQFEYICRINFDVNTLNW